MTWRETLNRVSENLRTKWVAEQEKNGDMQAGVQNSEQNLEEVGDKS